MQEYLDSLKEAIKEKKMGQFCVFPDLKTFKIIKKSEKEMFKIMQEKPAKYAGRKLAVVTLSTDKTGFKDNDTIFATDISIYTIYEDGKVGKVSGDGWRLLLKYLPEDLENHPFRMKSLERIIKIVYKRYVTSMFVGMYYSDFEKSLERLKNKKNKS